MRCHGFTDKLCLVPWGGEIVWQHQLYVTAFFNERAEGKLMFCCGSLAPRSLQLSLCRRPRRDPYLGQRSKTRWLPVDGGGLHWPWAYLSDLTLSLAGHGPIYLT